MKAAVWVLLLVGFNYRVRERCCCRRHLGFYFFKFYFILSFFWCCENHKIICNPQMLQWYFSTNLWNGYILIQTCQSKIRSVWKAIVSVTYSCSVFKLFWASFLFFFFSFFYSHTSSHPSLSTRTSFCWSLVALSECNLVLGGSCRLKSDLLMTL